MTISILHYLPSLDPTRGGPIRAVLDLSVAFAKRGHKVCICSPEIPEISKLAQQHAGVQFERLTPGLVRGQKLQPGAIAQVDALLAHADLLHVHGTWDYSNVQLGKLARQRSKPHFVSVRGMLDDWCMEQRALKKRLFLLAFGRAHLERAKAVHLTADAEFEQARKWFPRGNGIVIPNLLDLAPFRTLPGVELAQSKFDACKKNEPVVLFLSRVHIKKGAEVLLQAAAQLFKQGKRAQFVFAGAGEESYVKQLKQQAEQLGIADRVSFVGHVGGDLKVSLYQASLCLALPTFQENFGFVFPEAMAAGTPVITTKGVDIWPQLARGGALIVDRTAEAFAASIASLIDAPGQRTQLSSQARAFVFEEYDEDRIVAQFERMYGGSSMRH
jgi:glycosyltransferase involved in cell wall biosynthesis